MCWSIIRWMACIAAMSSSPPPLSSSQPLFVPFPAVEISGIASVKFCSSARPVLRVATFAAGGQASENPAPPGAKCVPSFSS